MTPYQRGCRDALLDLAAQLDKLADANEAAAEKIVRAREGKPHSPTFHNAVFMYEGYADAQRAAAETARTLAKRTPDDPEEPKP